jgi:hypothetical protein
MPGMQMALKPRLDPSQLKVSAEGGGNLTSET